MLIYAVWLTSLRESCAMDFSWAVNWGNHDKDISWDKFLFYLRIEKALVRQFGCSGVQGCCHVYINLGHHWFSQLVVPWTKWLSLHRHYFFRWIFVNEKICILIKILLKFVSTGPIHNNPALVQMMAWRRLGDKPLSVPMLTRFTDACMWHMGDELRPVGGSVARHDLVKPKEIVNCV